MDGACWGLVLSPVHLRLASLLYSSVMDFCKLKASISGDHQLTEAQGHRRLLQLKLTELHRIWLGPWHSHLLKAMRQESFPYVTRNRFQVGRGLAQHPEPK
uniref:Family with sequence similarity 131 member A n=1 Tax=Molossus molossus TaxID=27622 RepID=A0A7J8HZR6_MOLMO|nr:family with sequence similarity 131 member A [Molossus molossus]